MKPLRIVFDPDPPRGWVETVERGVDQHNVAATGLSDYYPVGFVIRGAAGELQGGLLGDIWGGWLHIGSLWVERASRGRGYATALMAAAERYGLSKQCSDAFLETGSYEARPFYEKLAYRTYAELKDHPVPGSERLFLEKPLDSKTSRAHKRGNVRLAMDPYPSAATVIQIREGISTHAAAAIGLPEQNWQAANFFLRDADGEIVGGALGNMWGQWLYVSFLWVDRSLRGRGHATKLIAAAETRAAARGCTGSYLGTFIFQARPLYEKLGYRVFGKQKDRPKGHSHYWLGKRLARK